MGLQYQWVGDGSDVDSMGVAGYLTMARARWRRRNDGTGQWRWHDGTVTMSLSQAHWHRHNGTATGMRTISGARCRRHDLMGTMHRTDGVGAMARAWHMV